MNYGFIRSACASPRLKVADCRYNSENIINAARLAAKNDAMLIVFPELCISGYSCGDLFFQESLQKGCVAALEMIAHKTASLDALIVLGLPLAKDGVLFDCAVFLYKGDVLAAIPKTYVTNYTELYEKRYFASAANIKGNNTVYISTKFDSVPFGADILICDKNNPRLVIAAEICEDLWSPLPPSSTACLSGASVVVNLAASNEIIGKAEYRRLLVKSQSSCALCAYLCAEAGQDESSQDLIFAGQSLIAECGTMLAEAKPFEPGMICVDIDLERIEKERQKMTTFADLSPGCFANYRRVYFKGSSSSKQYMPSKLLRTIGAFPFIPNETVSQNERYASIIAMQAEALSRRLRHINAKTAVIGLSGGLDSTLAYLVMLRAFDISKLDRKGIVAVTMPCFGTTDRTYKNACALAQKSGTSFREINIAQTVLMHFKDIGHDMNVHNNVYENAQSRERMQVLMDIANQINGIVIGTDDLSEIALGWCTYNGDQMSMYGVNSSVPKTLVRHLVEYFAAVSDDSELSALLRDILATPVSPELLPPESGVITQKTEDIVGPYELHDFFLYYMLRFGFSPAKILFLADSSKLPYSHEDKLRWMRIFYSRFFSQQFKRSCMPDGAKVGTVALSPRGDWRMPSDASAEIWLAELASLR